MSYSRRQLYAMGEPLGDGATRREVGGKVIYGGGGGGGTPERQTQIVDLPEWAKPYAKESLGKASALSASPYQAYGGERVAQFSPLQKQAFDTAAQQQVAGQIGFGSGLAGLTGTTSFRDQGMAGGFMSPYMQNVVDQQMSSAQRQADIAATQRGAQAVRAGAFGGSRQAVENAEANRALASQKGEIQARGLQSAYEQAQNQFNQEQAQRLNAAQALGSLGTQQFGQEMDITGQQAKYGADQRAATQEILSSQYQDFLNQQRAPYDQLAFMTSMIRGTPMGQTTTMYQPPANQTSQLIGLATAGAGAYGAYQGAQGRAAGGEVRSYAEGGGISALNQPQMAAMAGRMSDQQLGQTAQMPSITELARMTLAAEAQQRAQMRQQAMAQQAAMQQQPQTTVAEDQMAAIGGLSDLPAPNLEGMDETAMADGGIVAFQTGGDTSPFGRFVDRTSAAFAESNEANKLRNKLQMQYGPASAVPGLFYKQSDAERAEAQRIVELLPKLSFAQLKELEARGAAKSATPAAAPVATPVPVEGGLGAAITAGEDRKRAAARVAAAEKPPAPVTGKPVAAATGVGAAPVGLSALKAQTTSGMSDLQKQVQDINAARTEAAANQVERAKAQEAEMGEFGAEQSKRLQERSEGLKGAEDKNFNMALIEAGLAMMSGTSANAFENIGKGALVGTKAYTTGIERIQSRKEKLDDAVSALENAKRSDKRVSQERMDRLQANVDNAKTANAEALYNFGSKALDMSREDARFATEVALKQAQIAASNKQSFEERMVMALGKGDMAAGYKALKAMDAKPADLMGEFNDFLKANPMLATGPQEQAIAAYMRSKLALSGLGAVPPASSTASGPVRN